MTKFLHISDIHLGIKRYGIEERTTDFCQAWLDVIKRYAIGQRVDFVLIGGDLFDRRVVDAQAANHAMLGLQALRDANIPVFAIEGNHDQRESNSRFSWLRSFSGWGFFKLLEPQYEEETDDAKFGPWDEANRRGWYIDFNDVRIFGSQWYGASVTHELPQLCDALAPRRREGAFNILMLHTEVEGQLNKPIPALSLNKLLTLKESTDYLALGHIHKNFVIEDWAYNPGSLEACSIDEYVERRGAYLVEIKDGKAQAELIRDYWQRPFKRLEFDLTRHHDPEIVNAELKTFALQECQHNGTAPAPIVEITLTGTIGFKNSLLDLKRIRDEVQSEVAPMGLLFHNESVPREFADAAEVAKIVSRSEREQAVIEKLIALDSRYRERADDLAKLVLETKRLLLEEESEEKVFALIEQRIAAPKEKQATSLPPTHSDVAKA